ncbi:hypothetical protein FKV24_012850 [Lysobacter maris]|uniref:Uncharacterized protein n=1 Tax=Marilutibacter maris TaxID=1605891 RepID=A0A508AM89_9GAMM|nr:hypothetical protein [Lysobacter maris]KAB8179314.1 hypothetical protein FKV24_012850 [Lysobacter maris]
MPRVRLVAFLACVLAVVNALAFTYANAIPVPSADAWYFIDTFVRKAVDGNLGYLDFFAQRGAGDHSQPLHRIVLLVHLYAGDLDFRMEAMVGVVLGVVSCALLAHVLCRSISDSGIAGKLRCGIGAISIFLVGLSLNATNIYTWSLVSLAWISLLACVSYWIAAPRFSEGAGRLTVLCALTFTLGVLIDELALPAFVALICGVAVRDGWRAPITALRMAIVGGLGLALARLFLHLAAGNGAADAAGGSLGAMFEMLLGSGGWKAVVVPLSDSLVHREHLDRLFKDWAVPVEFMIAISLAVLHIGFWWRAFDRTKRPGSSVLVISVAMMLFFYATIFGIALSRASSFGADYFHQPRYVVVYQLNLLALILMFAGSGNRANGINGGVARSVWAWRACIAGVIALVLLQALLSLFAWRSAKYVQDYTRGAAESLAALGREPATREEVACPQILTICKAAPEVRMRTMSLLRNNALSIYSADFRHAHGLDALQLGQDPAAAMPAEDGSCSIPVLRGGPRRISGGIAFNRQPNGESAFWIMVPDSAPSFRVMFRGRALTTHRRGGLVTFTFDEEQAAVAASGERRLVYDIECDGRDVEEFVVEVDGRSVD